MENTKIRFLVWLILPVFMLLTGCNPIKEDQRANSLRNVLWAYEKTLRWGGRDELDEAWSYQTDELKKKNPPPDNLSNIRISGYTQIGAPVQIRDDVVEIRVRIDYILKDRQLVKEIIDRQRWKFNEEIDIWERITPVPGFK